LSCLCVCKHKITKWGMLVCHHCHFFLSQMSITFF
jgi:hypothetical protein